MFKQKLLGWGFRELTSEEFTKAFERLGLKAPRPQESRETGFIFTANGLNVYVWTTYLNTEQRARNSDAGWVLIADGDNARYFTHPMRRTRHFFHRLSKHAWIARWRAVNRPLCPKCSRYMKIAYGRALKSRYWICKNNKRHDSHKAVFVSWDKGMPPRALKFLKSQRKVRAKYRKTRTRAGKLNHVAMLNRAAWRKNRPQNAIKVS